MAGFRGRPSNKRPEVEAIRRKGYSSLQQEWPETKSVRTQGCDS